MTRLYLHIGLQKTGTSFLQNVCWASVDQLRDQGVTLVPERRIEAFWLALAVRERVDPAYDGERVARSLELLPGQLAAVETPKALITHEILGSAGPAQIQRLLAACAPHEVHVVVTVRDIARQVPSLWQECLKAGRSVTLDEYVAELQATRGRTTVDWRRLDLPAILRRWAAVVHAERIHVVTVPGPGGPREALLERYCAALGIRTDALDLADAGPGNPGLGTAEAELLRRVNDLIPEQYRRRVPYGRVGKRYFAMGLLAHDGGERARLTGDHEAWCRELAEESIATLADLGCDVIGEPEDLLPAPAAFGEAARPDDAAVLDVATRALAAMLEERMAQHLTEREQRTDEPSPPPARWHPGAVRARIATMASRARRSDRPTVP